MSASNLSGDSFGDEIDLACDRFESEWRAGARPQIEPYLAKVPEPARAGLACGLLKMEIHYRRACGDTMLPGDYTSRFPNHASLIDRLLSVTPNSSFKRPSRPSKFDLPTGPDLYNQISGANKAQASVSSLGAPTPTRLFGDYEILRKLGKGGM